MALAPLHVRHTTNLRPSHCAQTCPAMRFCRTTMERENPVATPVTTARPPNTIPTVAATPPRALAAAAPGPRFRPKLIRAWGFDEDAIRLGTTSTSKFISSCRCRAHPRPEVRARFEMADRGDVCTHDHDCGGQDCGGSSLHGYVDHPRVSVLNAEDDDAAPRVLRPWCDLRSPEGANPSPGPSSLPRPPFSASPDVSRPLDATSTSASGTIERRATASPSQRRRRPRAHPPRPLRERRQGSRDRGRGRRRRPRALAAQMLGQPPRGRHRLRQRLATHPHSGVGPRRGPARRARVPDRLHAVPGVSSLTLFFPANHAAATSQKSGPCVSAARARVTDAT